MPDDIEFDPAKDAANRLKHGLPLDRWPAFDDQPVVTRDGRFEYGEERLTAAGRINGRGHVVTFMIRDGRVRMIGFRRAHEKEMKRYGC